MIPITMAERIKQKRVAVDTAVARLNALDATLRPTNRDQAEVVENARVQLLSLMEKCEALGTALLFYSEPIFYAEFPPSRASEDKCKLAVNVLEYVFPE